MRLYVVTKGGKSVKEEWRDIKGFEGKYQVSNLGRVQNIKFKGHSRSQKQDRILSPKTNRGGYLCVHLSDGKKDYHPTIHQLVARAFIENPTGLRQVNHKDENKKNNEVSNLEWCTALYNTRYGTASQRAHENKKIPILQIEKDSGMVIKEHKSATDASVTAFGDLEHKKAISSCARGERHTAYGFIWKYKRDVTEYACAN